MYSAISQITVFDRSWFKNIHIVKDKTIINGEIPGNIMVSSQGCAFTSLVPKDNFSRLPLIDKFFSGKLPLVST